MLNWLTHRTLKSNASEYNIVVKWYHAYVQRELVLYVYTNLASYVAIHKNSLNKLIF